MRTSTLGKCRVGALLVFLLSVAAPAPAADFDFFDYTIPRSLMRWCKYTYTSPLGFPGFTLRITPITSGKYSGKYYWGDWNIPQNETDVWRIVSWDATNLYMHASQLGGDFPSPVAIPRINPLDTIVPNPIPGEVDYPWYFTFRSSLTVPAGTFNNVLLQLVLDINYPHNSMNDSLGLAFLPAVTNVTYHASGIGEIWNANIDAASGTIVYSYELQSTGISSAIAVLPLLLLD